MQRAAAVPIRQNTASPNSRLEAGVPVLPVAIWGKIRLFGRVFVRFGDPILLPAPPENEKYTKEDYQRLSQQILDTIYTLMEVPEIGDHKS